MFKSSQFLQISLPFYLQTILKRQKPKKQLIQLSQPINLFAFIGEIFMLCQNTIKDPQCFQTILNFIQQYLSINLQYKNNKILLFQNQQTHISHFIQLCLSKVPNSMKNIYLQLYMLFIRLFQVKYLTGMKPTQTKKIKAVENYITSHYRSIKLVLSFQSQYSRIQIKDYVELAVDLSLRNNILRQFIETLYNLNSLCQFPESTMQLIQKRIKQMQSPSTNKSQSIKTASKPISKKTFNEKEIFRNKNRKKILIGALSSKIQTEKKILETPQKQNKNSLENSNCIILSNDIIQRTPEYKCKYDVRNPETSKSPLKNSNKKFKTNRHLASPSSSVKKIHLIRKIQEKRKKKNRTLYITRKGVFNNSRKLDEYQIEVCKTATQTSIHFDSARKSSFIPAIIEHNSEDFDVLAHQTPKPHLKKTRAGTMGNFDRSGKFQLK